MAFTMVCRIAALYGRLVMRLLALRDSFTAGLVLLGSRCRRQPRAFIDAAG